MNTNSNPFKQSEKYVAWISWLVALTAVCVSVYRFPLSSAAFGDEIYYKGEVQYLAQYGLYNALTQGTSVVYTLLVYLFSKIFQSDYIVTARILSVIFFLISYRLLFACFNLFKGLSNTEKYFGLTFFAAIAESWLWNGLPDMICTSFFLAGLYLLVSSQGNRRMLLAGIVMFIGFAAKPVVLFAIPGIAVFIFFSHIKNAGAIRNATRTALFMFGFCACFIVYHIPGFMAYHRLMLEDKNHSYQAGVRVEDHNSWNERNVYYAVYNPNHRPTEWYVTWEEVDSFKKQHPEINLRMSYSQFVKDHFSVWITGIASKLFLALPFDIQHGFFFAKWTLINKMIKNFFAIRVITLLLILGICFVERQFIKQNLLLYVIPLSVFLGLSVYLYTPLQNNWMLFCLPFMALPVARFLVRNVNMLLLFALQLIYLLL